MSDAKTSPEEGVVGVGLFVAAYVDERRADDTLDGLKQARSDGEFYFDDAAVVRCDANGKVHIHETGDMSTGRGAGIGALIGGVIGVLGGPAGIAGGAAAGAAIGAIAAHTDGGFDDKSLKELGGALPPGSSALAVTTSQDFVEAVREESTDEETLTLAADIAAVVNEHLGARQDVLMAMMITEEGVAASKVVSSPQELAAFGIVATEKGTFARAGVATPEGTAVVDATVPPPEDEAADESV
jgi:uncharacterized membrane protein